MKENIPWLELVIGDLQDIELIEALYILPAQASAWLLLIVAEEHEDALYEQLVQVETKIDKVSPAPADIRVMAHQGRDPSTIVPSSAIEIFNRALIK